MIPSSPSFKQQLGDLLNQRQVLENKIQLHTEIPKGPVTMFGCKLGEPRPHGTIYSTLFGDDLKKVNKVNIDPNIRVVNEMQRDNDVRTVRQLQSELKDLDKKIEGLRKQNFPSLSDLL